MTNEKPQSGDARADVIEKLCARMRRKETQFHRPRYCDDDLDVPIGRENGAASQASRRAIGDERE